MERFRIHFDSWALQSELEQRLPELLPRLDTYEAEGALWARSSAYGDEQDWVLIRSADRGRDADVPRGGRRVPRRQARAGLRPGDLRARRRPPRDGQVVRGDRADARLRPGAGRGAAVPVRPPHPWRRGVEGVEAGGQRRLPRRLHGRGRRRRRALVPRQPRPGPGDRDRPRSRGREVAEEPGLLRPVRARADRRHPAERRGRAGRRRTARPTRAPRRRS